MQRKGSRISFAEFGYEETLANDIHHLFPPDLTQKTVPQRDKLGGPKIVGDRRNMARWFRPNLPNPSPIFLENGSRIGVVGGGPAGSFFSYFLLQFSQRVNLQVFVDIYEGKEFHTLGHAGCNMCAGVISESLIQALSIEGMELPADVVQRGINSFVLHSSTDKVTMYAPFHEMRIAAVYRGGGPRGAREVNWKSFDQYLLYQAESRGAKVISEKVINLTWNGDKPQLHTSKARQVYDLVVGAFGVNSSAGKLFENLGFGYQAPRARKTYNCELEFGPDFVSRNLGPSLHAFLLNLPQLEFGALVPKWNYLTLCLIGKNINSDFVDSFIRHPTVKNLITNGMLAGGSTVCRCAPLASLGKAKTPYGNRVVLIGDCGMSRLNKDGIGSAYRTAKAAAATAVFSGISANDFRKRYGPICSSIRRDNQFGRLLFLIVGIIKKLDFLNRGVMRMSKGEQQKLSSQPAMSMILWDMFTGSAPYRDVFWRSLHPPFIGRFIWNTIMAFRHKRAMEYSSKDHPEVRVGKSPLGKHYREGEIIVRQGEKGNCMYVIQSGRAEVVIEGENCKEIQLAVLSKGDFFGEMAIIEEEVRSATVRALDEVRVIVVDKRIFLQRIHEDPSFAFRIMEKMGKRIREMDHKILHAGQGTAPSDKAFFMITGTPGSDRRNERVLDCVTEESSVPVS